MTAPDDRCLDPEVHAALVVGGLSGAELVAAAEHFRECEECREVAAEAARVDRETSGREAVAIHAPGRRAVAWRRWGALAAALAGIAVLSLYRSEEHTSEL